MATITIQTGEIDNYQGAEGSPLLRIFVSKNFVASDGDVIPRSSFEEGDFYKEYVCSVASEIVTYPEMTIDSTADALSNPEDATYRFDLFTAAGLHIQNLFKEFRVPAAPTPTTLGALAAVQDTIDPAPAGAYSTDAVDAMVANLQAQIDGIPTAGLAIVISRVTFRR